VEILYDSVLLDTCPYIFAQTHRIYIIKKVNLGLCPYFQVIWRQRAGELEFKTSRAKKLARPHLNNLGLVVYV
jgi:hypothetical protein